MKLVVLFALLVAFAVAKPDVPTGLRIINAQTTSSQIVGAWDDMGLTYEVQIATSTSGWNTPDGSFVSQGALKGFRCTGLQSGTNYGFRVRAVDNTGNSAWAAYVVGKTSAGASVPYPDNILNDLVSLFGMEVMWDQPTNGEDITKYMIRWKDAASNVWGNSLYFPAKESMHTNVYKFCNLMPGTEYEYQVKAMTDNGDESMWSDSYFFSTLGYLPPSAPVPTENSVTDSQIQITWEEPADGGNGESFEYRIRYAMVSDGTWTTSGWMTETFMLYTDLMTNTQYEFQVQVRNEGLERSVWSDSLTVRTAGECVYFSETFDGDMLTQSFSSYEEGSLAMSFSNGALTVGQSSSYVMTVNRKIDYVDISAYTWSVLAEPQITIYYEGYPNGYTYQTDIAKNMWVNNIRMWHGHQDLVVTQIKITSTNTASDKIIRIDNIAARTVECANTK